MKTWAYVFITRRNPKWLLPQVRAIPGVIHTDALFGSPDVIAIVMGEDIATMDAVIDEIALLPDVGVTDSKIVRWLDGVGPPRPSNDGSIPG